MLIEFKTLAKDWADRRREARTSKGRKFGALTMCRECYTFRYNNSWHFEKPENLESYKEGSKVPVNFTQCPACLQQEIAAYDMESELVWRQV